MKYKVKVRRVIYKEFTVVVEADGVVEAMDKSLEDRNKMFNPDWCYHITKSAWAPVSVTEVKQERENINE